MLERIFGTERNKPNQESHIKESLQDLNSQLAIYSERSNVPQMFRHEGVFVMPPKNLEVKSVEGQVIFERAKAFVSGIGYTLIEVERVDGLESRNGVTRTESRQIEIKRTLSENMKAKVAIHEIVHAFKGDQIDKKSRQLQEIVAEGTSHVVASHFGLDTSSYSVPYISAFSGCGREKGMLRKAKRQIALSAQILIKGLEQTVIT